MDDKRLYGAVTVGTKGQVVIPADAREAFDIKPGDRLYVLGNSSSKWLGLIPEEQLRTIISKFTDHIETFKDVLEDSTNPKKEQK